jgi:nitrogen regulatory protein P-II 1
MKKLEAIIKPFRLQEVKAALAELGIEGMTVLEAEGFGKHKGHVELEQGRELVAASLPKLKIDIILEDSQVDGAVEAILAAAKTGRAGDGKICITTVDEVVRIRTAEKGEHAL